MWEKNHAVYTSLTYAYFRFLIKSSKSKEYSLPNEVKVELFRAIFECRVVEFTYALLTEVPQDTSKITAKPWTTLVSNFLMDEGNNELWEKLIKNKPTTMTDIYKYAKQIRNCLAAYNRDRRVFSGLKTVSKKIVCTKKKAKSQKPTGKLFYSSSSDPEDIEESSPKKTRLSLSTQRQDEGQADHNPWSDSSDKDADISSQGLDDSFGDPKYTPTKS